MRRPSVARAAFRGVLGAIVYAAVPRFNGACFSMGDHAMPCSKTLALAASFVLLNSLTAIALAQTDEELRAMYNRKEQSRMQEIAESGDVRAQAWMGLMLQNQGRRAESKQWWLRAAERGNLWAMTSLAQMASTDGDIVEATKWVRRGAEAGHASSQASYGNLLATGRGVEKDEREAVRWYIEALSRGERRVSLSLAEAYDQGKGVPRDAVEAYALATVAESAISSSDEDGRQQAAKLKARLSEELSPEREEQAARRAREILKARR
jgi:TPR repeat protein